MSIADDAFHHIKRAAEAFGVPPQLIASRSHTMRAVWPRQAVMAALRDQGYSLPRIGRVLSRDHTTILNGLRKHEARLRSDPNYARHHAAMDERPPMFVSRRSTQPATATGTIAASTGETSCAS